MHSDFEPGDRIKLNGGLAEVIRAYKVGDLPYLRVYIEGEGAKTVCVEHVSIESADDALSTLDGLNSIPDTRLSLRSGSTCEQTRSSSRLPTNKDNF